MYFFFAIPFYIFSPIPPHTMCFLFTLFHFSVFATDSPSVQFIPPIIFFQFIFLCTLFNNNNNNATREKIKVKDLCVCDREKSIVSSGICYSLCFTSSSFLYRLIEWLIHRSTCCCWWWWCVVDVVVVVLFRTFILFLSFSLSLHTHLIKMKTCPEGIVHEECFKEVYVGEINLDKLNCYWILYTQIILFNNISIDYYIQIYFKPSHNFLFFFLHVHTFLHFTECSMGRRRNSFHMEVSAIRSFFFLRMLLLRLLFVFFDFVSIRFFFSSLSCCAVVVVVFIVVNMFYLVGFIICSVFCLFLLLLLSVAI